MEPGAPSPSSPLLPWCPVNPVMVPFPLTPVPCPHEVLPVSAQVRYWPLCLRSSPARLPAFLVFEGSSSLVADLQPSPRQTRTPPCPHLSSPDCHTLWSPPNVRILSGSPDSGVLCLFPGPEVPLALSFFKPSFNIKWQSLWPMSRDNHLCSPPYRVQLPVMCLSSSCHGGLAVHSFIIPAHVYWHLSPVVLG